VHRRTCGPGLIPGELDSGLMAKDKSEKKKRHASDAVHAEAEEDVEMKVSNNYACLKE
jgi:hypothetical protein